VAWLPYPGDGTSPSMILAIERGREHRFFAIDLEQKPDAFEPGVAFGEDEARIIALMLPDRLADLRLSPGPLEPAPVPHQRLGELRMDASYLAVLHEGVAFEWTPLGTIDAAILDFPVPQRDERCARLEQEIILRHPDTTNHFLVPLAGGEALAGYGNTVSRLTAGGAVAESATLAGLISATRTSTAIFVLADALYRASIDPLRFERLADFPAGATKPDWMSAGTHDQIFAFAGDGSFSYFDGRSFRLLDDLRIDGDGVGNGGALWLAPGEGAAVSPSNGNIVRWDGALHEDFVLENVLGFGAGLRSERFGAVIIDDRWGQLFFYDGGGLWRFLSILGGAPRVQALTDFRDGLAWGTSTGLVGYATERYSCPSVPVLDGSEVFELSALGDGLVAGYIDRNTDYVLIYFRPSEK
jgi:hypothetical protein